MLDCNPSATQYTIRQEAKFAIIPATTRAKRMPRRRPERTIESADALFSGGARSAAKGMRIWGTTDVPPIRKLRTSNTLMLDVRGRPMVKAVDRKIKSKIRDRRRTRSPSGVIRSRPVAYLGSRCKYRAEPLWYQLTPPVPV